MKTKEPKSMEEIHSIRENMYAQTSGMSVHDKLLFIKEKAEAFKSKYGLKTKPVSRQEKHVTGHKG
jgi:hypothetical protein